MKHDIKQLLKQLILIGVFLFVIIISVILCFKTQSIKTEQPYALRIYRDNIEIYYEGARAKFIKEIDLVIREAAPTTCMNGLAILNGYEEYGVDIFFVLAQGHIESHFGTRGMAARTNSVFNVYAYDGLKYADINRRGKYEHPDLSIIPYLKLLRDQYIVDGKTEIDLMHNYVNKDGKRYASNEQYETLLTNMYNKYISREALMGAYEEYIKYKILSGN